MLLLKEMLGGPSGDINQKRNIEKYCTKLMEIIATKGSLEKDLELACKKFDGIFANWVETKGDTARFHIKDNSEFTKFMISSIGENDAKFEEVAQPINKGKVINVQTDKRGNFFGFISRLSENIWC